MFRTPSPLVAAIALFSATCSTQPQFTPVLGTIQLRDAPVEYLAPARWPAGVEFTVSITTFGGCRMERGFTRTRSVGSEVTITPYDLVEVNPPPSNCPSFQTVWHHSARVTIDDPGPTTLLFRGLRTPTDDTVTAAHVIDIF